MTTVEERREAARRLRGMGEELGSSVLLWYYIAKILGVLRTPYPRSMRGGGEMKEWIVCADKPTRAMERMRVGDVVRCRDCASIKPTTDGRHYCARWSHIVPLDGFCWRGEEKSGEEEQEG